VLQSNFADTGAPIVSFQRNVTGNGITFGAKVIRKSTNNALSEGVDGTGLMFAVDNGNGASNPQTFAVIDGIYSTTVPTIRLRTTTNNGSTYSTCISATGLRTSINNTYLQVPRVTTATRDAASAANGDIIYNTTTNKFQGYENGTWTNLI
jgi:hypothetical protein